MWPTGVAVTPAGAVIVEELPNYRLRRISPILPGFSELLDVAITSEDGTQIFQFNRSGRHLRTLNALTGSTVFTFAYDAAGGLTSVTDGDGNRTTIERDASGNPLAIEAPDGLRTTMTVNGDGYITSATNPAGEVSQATYDAGGLLTSFTKPRGEVSQYTYDPEGRLLTATSADLYGQTLARTNTATGYQVTRASALGRTTGYRVENLPVGGQRRTTTFPDGTTTVVDEGTDGRTRTTLPDGSVTEPLAGARSTVSTCLRPFLRSRRRPMEPTDLRPCRRRERRELSDPADPLSLVSMTETRTLNGRATTSVYTAATRTWVEHVARGTHGHDGD